MKDYEQDEDAGSNGRRVRACGRGEQMKFVLVGMVGL